MAGAQVLAERIGNHVGIRDFCRVHAVRELAVFGSAVRDDFDSDSDVDVLIEFAPDACVGLIGFRNIAVHAYFSVDWRIVFVTVTDDLPELKSSVISLLGNQ